MMQSLVKLTKSFTKQKKKKSIIQMCSSLQSLDYKTLCLFNYMLQPDNMHFLYIVFCKSIWKES
jgi:hypothetical protein